MNISLIDKISDWNPQLFRELKGRLKPQNVAIAVGLSILGQLLLLISFFKKLSVLTLDNPVSKINSHEYCTGPRKPEYDYIYGYDCVTDALGNVIINWQQWWIDIFLWLSFVGIFAVLVIGTYMLINDLAKEERRGTLNFIQLSPRSTRTILLGKLLGVPILLYLAALLAMPLHLWASINAQIPLFQLLMFYGAVGASCLFFYSGAQLFGLVSGWLGGFQPWLGSGLILIFLSITSGKLEHYSNSIVHTAIDWINLLNPSILLPYLVFSDSPTLQLVKRYFSYKDLQSWQWLYQNLNASITILFCLILLNFAVGTYWIWQGLYRRFRNSGATWLSKKQSYALVACFQGAIIGFALQQNPEHYSLTSFFYENLSWILMLNQFLFLGLIAVLSPHRQELQDWARYRHQMPHKGWGSGWQDLIWAEKSPAPVAIALNLVIASALIVPWIFLWPAEVNKTPAFAAMLLSMTVILLCAIVAQLMLLIKTNKRGIWATGTVSAIIILPIIIFAVLSIDPKDNPILWLFSVFPWTVMEHTLASTMLRVFIGQIAILGGLSFQLTRQLHSAGESATKALLKKASS